MGFDLVRKKACFSFNYETWWEVITVAVGCGWEPTGTGPPRGVLAKNWPGTYYSNSGQLLYARDAKCLADTLENVIAVPGTSSLDFEPSRISRWLRISEGQQSLGERRPFKKLVRLLKSSDSGKETRRPGRSLPWILSDDGRSCLRDFIKFCRGGSFRMY